MKKIFWRRNEGNSTQKNEDFQNAKFLALKTQEITKMLNKMLKISHQTKEKKLNLGAHL